MAENNNKHHGLKRWILLCFSLVAAVIWLRNLFIFLPQGESHVDIMENPVGRQHTAAKKPFHPATFDDTSGWTDPFAPPEPKRSPVIQLGSKKKAPSGPAPEPPPWKLAGVVWNRKVPAAILTSLSDNRRVVVAEGDTLGSARIERIDQQHVLIRHDGKTWTLALEGEGSPFPH